MLPRIGDYEALCTAFAWDIPDRYNIGVAVCDFWAAHEPDRTCLYFYHPDGPADTLTYGDLRAWSNALANGLRAAGVERGDRVALLLPQGFETAAAHIAIYKLGAIAVPLASLFGVEALQYRLESAGAKAVISDRSGCAKIRQIRDQLPNLRFVVCTQGSDDAHSFDALTADHSPDFEPEETGPDDPALMIFTSGTTGPPKGALHGHRVLPGHLPGIAFAHEFMPQPDDLFWTPADWAWAGGLLNVLLPALTFGVPVVASKAQKFDPVTAFMIMERMQVRNAFIPPTALRLLRTVDRPAERFDLRLRTIGSAGESLGRETYEWGLKELGIVINEFYGQTECNAVIGSCAAIGVSRAGEIGKAVPGHRVAIVDTDGQKVAAGVPGQIAIRGPDPVMFLGYWNNDAATRAKFKGDWMLTGDQGIESEDGYIAFFGREDDVITSAGYRIGPGEIEDCMTGHPAVALAAAVGKPDPLRTEIVKAYVVLKPGNRPTHALAGELQDWIKTRLSAHEYPREVEFVDSLPMTTTGKVIRRELRERAKREALSFN